MGLILTYAPHEDESGLGYYRRLAADNALLGWRGLAATAGVESSRRALLMRTDDASRNLGLEPGWAESARQKEECCRGWGRLQRTHSDAVCPACMAEAPYLRHYWGHAYATACPKHRIQLVDQCNACGGHLSPQRFSIGLCACSHDLASLPRIPATRAQVWLSALIAGDGQPPGDRLGPAMRDVETDVLAKVVRTLCLHADPAKPVLPRAAATPRTVTQAIEFLAPLEALLADWPTGFRAHVEQRIAAGREDARTLNTLLGDWYISLRKTCPGTAFEPLLQAIIDVAAEKSECVLGLDSTKAIAEEVTRFVRAPDAARTIGVSVSRLHEAMHDGECAHRTRRVGTRGLVYEVSCAEVERIQQRRAGWISYAAACEWAGVPPAVLERMKAAGVIRSDVRWREDLMKGGPVERQSLMDLYAHVGRQVQVMPTAEGPTLTWSEFSSRRMGEKRAIELLMQAIANGDVRAVAPARTLGEIPFLRADVSRYFGTPMLEAGMSIHQLSKATGWKWESISHWMDEGLLACESVQLRGQPCRVVLPHQLLAFRQSYIPLADLARAMGTKASAMSQALPGIELVGAKRLPDGAVRGGLLRIADIARLAVIGAKAGYDLFVPSA